MFLSPGSRARTPLVAATRKQIYTSTNIFPQGRLSLASNTPVSITNITAATTIYYTGGGQVPVWNGSRFIQKPFTQLVLPLDSTNTDPGYHAPATMFDCFVVVDSGVLRLGTGPAWSTSASRGTGAGTTELVQINGIWVNKNTIALRYGNSTQNITTVLAGAATFVGSFFTTGASGGETYDSAASRLLWNAYNQVARKCFVSDPVNTFNYSVAAWAQYNSNTANQVSIVTGLIGTPVSLRAVAIASNSTATLREVYTGIGVNSTTVNSAASSYNQVTNTNPGTVFAFYDDCPGLGLFAMNWLIYGNGADTQTWFGNNAGVSKFTPGLSGQVFN